MISILKPIKLFVLTVALLLSFVSELDSIGSKHFFKANPENPETASLIPLDYFRSKGINIDESSNLNLYRYVYKWLGTPHVMGGKTRRGIDCSGFVIKVYEKIYSYRFKGGAGDILKKVKPVKKRELKEGDLLFFKKKGIIYHVGLYLSNNKFIHSASKYGVMVNDLTENYYRKYFYSAGRLGDYEPNITSDDNAELEEEIKAIPVIAGKISKAPNIEKKKGVIYKVQFGVYQSPLDTMDFMVSKIHGKIPEANFSCTRISDIKYKYYAGEFKTLREAQKINNKLKKCFKMNSFIVAFKNDKRISLKAAKKIKNY